MLDKFEEQFIGFCNYKPLSKNLILKEEIIDPSYTNSNKGIVSVKTSSTT